MKLGASIPPELYQAVVEIYLYFLGFVPDENREEAKQGPPMDETGSKEDRRNDRNMEK